MMMIGTIALVVAAMVIYDSFRSGKPWEGAGTGLHRGLAVIRLGVGIVLNVVGIMAVIFAAATVLAVVIVISNGEEVWADGKAWNEIVNIFWNDIAYSLCLAVIGAITAYVGSSLRLYRSLKDDAAP